jgi:hypothetical protein
MHGIEQNPKLGFYTVGDRTFYSKPEAMIYATQVGLYPQWHFNTKQFGSFDWEKEPEADLRELYRLRAQQLRDRYDYIRIEASGGGDSTTAIFSFLLNGIHLDEVVFRYPKGFEKDVVGNPHDTRAENTLSEWEFAAKPLMHWIKTNYPAVKVTFHDYSVNLLNSGYMDDESWIYTTRDWFQPGHGIKHDNFGTTEHKALADSGKSICALYGVDKPRVGCINNEWYLFFIDYQANHSNPIVGDHTNITSELFYWSPDLPELLAKQAHMIRRWFDMPHNLNMRYLTEHSTLTSIEKRTTYEHLVKSIIYPDYDLSTWQTAKPRNSFYNEMDHWFYTNCQDTSLYSVWESGIQYLVDKVESKYMFINDNRPVGFRSFVSPYYYLGPSTSVNNRLPFSNPSSAAQAPTDIWVLKNKKLQKITV